MICYHGSYCVIENPNLDFSREALDFGKGFYLTTIKEQACNWAKIMSDRKNLDTVILNIYKFDLEDLNSKDYSIKCFEFYDEEWLDFIIDCRNGKSVYKDFDVIIGGVADDKIYNTLNLYLKNLITKGETLNRLKYIKSNNQICITNIDLLRNYLKYINSEVV